MQFLKQSTAIKVVIGPVVTAAAMGTPVTNATLAANEALLVKHDGGAAVDLSGRTWAHLAGGLYNLTLTAADTDTLGMLTVTMQDASSIGHVARFMVVPAQVWDSLFGADLLQVDAREFNGNAASGFLTGTTMFKGDVTQIGGNAVAGFLTGTAALKADAVRINGVAAAAERHAAAALGIVTGTVASGSTTTAVVTDLAEATNDHLNSRTVVFTSGALDGQAAQILDYTGATKTLTVTALTEAPANGTTFVIV